MLVELAVGDAYGAGFEYAGRALIESQNNLTHFVKHPRHGIIPGAYTDDTQMSLAIAEAIVSGDDWTPLNLASRFVEAFRRDPREGYAARFYEFLKSVQDGRDFLDRIVPTSDKSGAAMRAMPIGVFATVGAVVEKATVQARITHDTPDGIAAGVASALMAHYCLHGLGPKRHLPAFLVRHVPGYEWNEAWQGKVKSKGWMSVRAALTALVAHDRMTDLLLACVAFSGDVDTVAAIALACGTHCAEVAQDLPESLVWQLENGQYGREYLAGLDARLLADASRS